MLLIIPCNPTLTVLGLIFLGLCGFGLVVLIASMIYDAIQARNLKILEWITNKEKRKQGIEDCTYKVHQDTKEEDFNHRWDWNDTRIKILEEKIKLLEEKKKPKHTN